MATGLRLKAVVTALALMGAGAVGAIEVNVENYTDEQVAMAFSYKPTGSKEWVVEGWFNVEAQQDALIPLDTDNDIYYLYAEFSNGKKLEGGNGAADLKVQDRSFSYVTEPLPETGREASFVRARSNSGKATIRIK